MSFKPRMNRLFADDGKCFDVAIDHGIFNEPSFLVGIENIEAAIATIVHANPDAIQLTTGQAEILQKLPGKLKPALVLRTDIANVYGKTLPKHLFSQLIEEPILQAIALDASCVVVNLIGNPDQPELYHQCLRNVVRLKPECDKYGMPLMVEPLVMKPNADMGGYMIDGDLDKIIPLVRQAVELGADIIKADPCDNPFEFHKIVEAASDKPVLPRGGGMTSEREILDRTRILMDQGGKGIVYGRNIIQHRSPLSITRAFMAIVHDGAGVDEAIRILKESGESAS